MRMAVCGLTPAARKLTRARASGAARDQAASIGRFTFGWGHER